jgi:hypothetical protein
VSHEQSETIKRNGKWINVFGKKTKRAGDKLPGSGTFKTVDAASKAAGRRSAAFDRKGTPGKPNPKIMKHLKDPHKRKRPVSNRKPVIKGPAGRKR